MFALFQAWWWPQRSVWLKSSGPLSGANQLSQTTRNDQFGGKKAAAIQAKRLQPSLQFHTACPEILRVYCTQLHLGFIPFNQTYAHFSLKRTACKIENT